ncbi:MAG TPA: ABC transporter permease [Anaerolineae bacterium]|nr:ABC transporter permease [Caldilineae bacterium]HID33021.1 ABC transporter permease [Anaerolineae bacterium]HIQ11629.1 ABC transporter permease [Caldilineales bacterium]
MSQSSSSSHRLPRFSLERRLTTPWWLSWAIPLASMALALLAGALIIASQGVNPWAAYRAMFEGAFGTGYGVAETLVKAIPLMLAGLGVSVAFRMKLWNIGAEGQLWMGAWAAAGVGLYLYAAWNLPPWLAILLMMGAALLAGGLWGAIPGVLKGVLQVNEIITSLMLNYVAMSWVLYFVDILWRDPGGLGFPNTAILDRAIWLPKLTWLPLLPKGHRVHAGLLLAILAAVFVWFLLNRTKWGYEVRVIGENPEAARHAGMPTARNIILVMMLSGALAGLAGMTEMAGVAHRLQRGLSPSYGYTAIIVAWLAKLNPFGVLLVAVLFGGLLVAGDQIQLTMNLPRSISDILQGLILFFVLGGEIFSRYRLRIR